MIHLSFNSRTCSALTLTIVAALMMSLVALFAYSATAQQDAVEERIGVAPSSERFTINAGDVKRDSLKIVNNGNTDYDFIVYARPYSVSTENYDPVFEDASPNTDVYKWVQFDQARYSIKSGETIEVNYTMRVPEDATPGGHYGVIFAETQSSQVDGNGVSQNKRVGSLLYVTVNGEYRIGGKFENFELPFWQYGTPMQSSARVTNTGNTDFEAKVNVVASDLFGNDKFTYDGTPIVLPQTTRNITIDWADAPSFGLFKVAQQVQFLDQTHRNEGYVLLAPRWVPALLLTALVVGVVYAIVQYRKSRR